MISTVQLQQQCTLTPQPRQVSFPLQCNVSYHRYNSFGKYRWPVVCRTLSRYIAFFVQNKRSPCILPAPHPYSWDCTVKLKNARQQIHKHTVCLQNRSYRRENKKKKTLRIRWHKEQSHSTTNNYITVSVKSNKGEMRSGHSVIHCLKYWLLLGTWSQ